MRIHKTSMKDLKTIPAAILLLLCSLPVSGWGAKGHDIVASVAEQHLTLRTRRALNKILDGQTIVYYSSWMDNVQNSPYWKGGYDATKTWHYANIDKGETYQSMRKNPKGDVVTALDSLTREFREHRSEMSDSLKRDCIRIIVHLVGDIHCPMHAGRLSDLGGNRTRVRWFGQNTNLHSVWDSKMIESARKWSYTEWTDQIDRADRKERRDISKGTFEDWLTETSACASEIYEYVESRSDTNLSYQFVYDFTPMLEERLTVAGYRLAFVLNSLF